MHVHLYEFSDEEVESILSKMPGATLVAVSEDVESLVRVAELASSYKGRVVACAGFHPWNIGEEPIQQAEELLRAAYRMDLACIGEVGLDRRFVPDTWSAQLEVFRAFLEYAVEVDGMVNIHAPDAWRDAFSMLLGAGVRRALFHWYTGPQDLAWAIGEAGYRVSVNPALRIQRKHRAIAKAVPLDYMVLESDGPYNYRGLRLTPLMIPEAIGIVAEEKGVAAEEVAEAAARNSESLLAGIA